MSIAQMPVPVPISRIRWGASSGARCSLLSRSNDIRAWCKSRLVDRGVSGRMRLGYGGEHYRFCSVRAVQYHQPSFLHFHRRREEKSHLIGRLKVLLGAVVLVVPAPILGEVGVDGGCQTRRARIVTGCGVIFVTIIELCFFQTPFSRRRSG